MYSHLEYLVLFAVMFIFGCCFFFFDILGDLLYSMLCWGKAEGIFCVSLPLTDQSQQQEMTIWAQLFKANNVVS